MSGEVFKIAIVGKGFAACMGALALAKQIPDNIELTFIHIPGSQPNDYLYGSISSPQAYQNNLMLGISEPELFLNTKSAFSFGTHYSNWGKDKLQWMQCFHLPFIAEQNVPFHHLLTKQQGNITDYLISAQAAKLGRFAHPPTENTQSALSRAEYGYHFDVNEWSALFLSKLTTLSKAELESKPAHQSKQSHRKLNIIQADIKTVHTQNNTHDSARDNEISYLELSDGQRIEASLFIDCTGPEAQLVSALNNEFDTHKYVMMNAKTEEVAQTGPSCRLVKGQVTKGQGQESIWQSLTPLQNKNLVLSLRLLESGAQSHADSSTGSSKDRSTDSYSKTESAIALGQRPQAWIGNCVAFGHSAYLLEPLTPAPYILLSLDIKRFSELIPIDNDMTMERKEYNRRYSDDVSHAKLFEDAFYINSECNTTENNHAKLERKIQQFVYRGVLAKYDLEPFNDEDWIILHWGMNRIPQRYDKLADQLDAQSTGIKLANMKNGIAHLASQIPPHHLYIEKFLQYIREQHGSK